MSDKKVIAVIGATGAQGGSLVRAILKDGTFAVRALSRDTNSEKAQELKKLGAEIVKANVEDEASLVEAIKGSYGLFCVSFFWQIFSPEKEMTQAKNMAEAAKKAGIKHVIWSTLEDTRKFYKLSDPSPPTLHGKYKVPHFDGKGEADAFFAGLPTTYLLTTFYWDNFIGFGMGPKKGPAGKLYINLPLGKKRLAGIAAEDIGKSALGVFKRPDLIGKRVGIAGEHLTGAQLASKLSKALGKEIHYNEVPFDVYRGFGFPGADDIGNMFQFYHDFEEAFVGARNLDETRKLNPELLNFDQWLAKYGSKIPVE